MIGLILKKIVGSRNDRILKSVHPLVDQINSLEPQIKVLSDEALKAKTEEFKRRLTDGISVDEILPEAFFAVA